MALAKCQDCIFYQEMHYNNLQNELVICDWGKCRRFPPKNYHDLESNFPYVNNDDYCGEFIKKI